MGFFRKNNRKNIMGIPINQGMTEAFDSDVASGTDHWSNAHVILMDFFYGLLLVITNHYRDIKGIDTVK